MILATNASGREISPDTMVPYKDSDVLTDFNGTFGNNTEFWKAFHTFRFKD